MDRDKSGMYRKLLTRGTQNWFQHRKWTRFVWDFEGLKITNSVVFEVAGESLRVYMRPRIKEKKTTSTHTYTHTNTRRNLVNYQVALHGTYRGVR